MRSNVLINHTLSTALGTIDKHLQIFNKPTLSEYQYKFDLNHEHEIELVHSTFGEIGLKKRKSPNILYVCIASNKYTVMNSSFLYLLGDCINTIACVRNTKAIQSSYISKVTSSEILSQVRSSPLGEEWFSHSRLYQPSDRRQKGNSADESPPLQV